MDRFSLVNDVIDRVPQLAARAAYAKQAIRDKLIEHKAVYRAATATTCRTSETGDGASDVAVRPGRTDTSADNSEAANVRCRGHTDERLIATMKDAASQND